jgi:hypothetical protein
MYETSYPGVKPLTHFIFQEKIFEEITETLETSGGKIDHESISKLHYLEAAICENLRINGPANDNFR